MRVAATVFVLLLVVPGLAAGAGGPVRTLTWEYRVSLPEPESGKVHVELRFLGLDGVVDRLTLLTGDHAYPVTDILGGPRTPLSAQGNGVGFRVDEPIESLSFDIAPFRPAFHDGESLAHVGADFALFKAESIAVAFTYQYFQGKPFVWKARVVFDDLPAGWRAEAPWPRGEGESYLLPGARVLPRGFVVMGAFEKPQTFMAGGKEVTYVRLGAAGAFEDDFEDYLNKATPYYEAVYGPGTGDRLLVVSAPDPMFRGGLGASDSLYLHETSTLRTLAHEYAHVHQHFGTVERAPESAIWFNEGDADLQGALSLFAAGFWTPTDVDRFFDETRDDARDASLRSARLVDATYGTSLERFAYHKGMTVLRALDDRMRADSSGALGIADLLRKLNKERSLAAEGIVEPVTNAELQAMAESLVGSDLAEFFKAYVQGAEWPSTGRFVPEGGLLLDDLRVDPPAAAPGEPVQVTARAQNSGTKRIERPVGFALDEALLDEVMVKLGVGESTRLTFRFVAPAAGDHELTLGYLTETFRSLRGPEFRIARASFVPETVYAGEAVRLLVFVQNEGERLGSGRIEVLDDGKRVALGTEVFVEGGATQSVAVPMNFELAGPRLLSVRVIAGSGDAFWQETVVVKPADADRDGVPDDKDAYPFNARLAEASVANDARNAVPFAWGYGVIAFGAALVLSRRR